MVVCILSAPYISPLCADCSDSSMPSGAKERWLVHWHVHAEFKAECIIVAIYSAELSRLMCSYHGVWYLTSHWKKPQFPGLLPPSVVNGMAYYIRIQRLSVLALRSWHWAVKADVCVQLPWMVFGVCTLIEHCGKGRCYWHDRHGGPDSQWSHYMPVTCCIYVYIGSMTIAGVFIICALTQLVACLNITLYMHKQWVWVCSYYTCTCTG